MQYSDMNRERKITLKSGLEQTKVNRQRMAKERSGGLNTNKMIFNGVKTAFNAIKNTPGAIAKRFNRKG